jgi:prepilin-type N-terminal cleavage/methylation domain-containing protein
MKQINKIFKGFTIIELVVVIAIIAVLAAIVVINVTNVKVKGQSAAIKGELKQLLTAATSYYQINGNLTGFCTSTEAVNILNYLKKINSTYTGYCNTKGSLKTVFNNSNRENFGYGLIDEASAQAIPLCSVICVAGCSGSDMCGNAKCCNFQTVPESISCPSDCVSPGNSLCAESDWIVEFGKGTSCWCADARGNLNNTCLTQAGGVLSKCICV